MYPSISKKRLDKVYKPNLNKLKNFGKNLNINLDALKFEKFTNYQEHFLNNGEYINPNIDTNNINQNTLSEITRMNSELEGKNLEREFQLKQQELLQLENKDLNKQLVELQKLQTNIFSKERLIEDNMVQSSNYETGIRALSASILFGTLLFLVIYLYGKNTMNPNLLKSIGILLIVIYILVIFYIYNVLYLQDSLNNIISFNFLAGIGSEIQKKTDEVNAKLDKLREDGYKTWVQNNCSCPVGETITTTDTSGLQVFTGEEEEYQTVGAVSGIYYQDGSSPNQLLFPPNTRANSGVYKDKIEYVDYSRNYSDFPETRSRENFENRTFGIKDIMAEEENEDVNIFGNTEIGAKKAPLIRNNVYTSGL